MANNAKNAGSGFIKKFDKINFRSFHDFKWPKDLLEFKKYNLIYGWNGSGKTTLSTILRAIEKGKLPDMKKNIQFEISTNDINNEIIKKKDIDSSEILRNKIRVFNQDYINDSIDKVLDDEHEVFEPIFRFGDNNIKLQKDIDDLDKNIKKLKKQYLI